MLPLIERYMCIRGLSAPLSVRDKFEIITFMILDDRVNIDDVCRQKYLSQSKKIKYGKKLERYVALAVSKIKRS